MATENGLKRYDGESVTKISFNDSIDDHFVYTAYLPSEDALLCLSYFGAPILVDVSSTICQPIKYKQIGGNHPEGFYNSIVLLKNNIFLHYPGKSNQEVIEFSKGRISKKINSHNYSYLFYQSPTSEYFLKNQLLIKVTKTGCDTLYTFNSYKSLYLTKVVDMRINSNFLFFYDGKLMKVSTTNDKVTELYNFKDLSAIDINGIGSDNYGNYWVFTKKGALFINKKGGTKWLLTDKDVNSGFLDQTGKWYWLSTFDDKLFKIPVAEPTHQLYTDLSIDNIFSTSLGLCYISNNKLFVIQESNVHEQLLDFANTNLVKQNIQNVIIEGDKLFIYGQKCLVVASKTPFIYTGPEGSKNSRPSGKYHYIEELSAVKGFAFKNTETQYLSSRNTLLKVNFVDDRLYFDALPNFDGIFKNLITLGDTLYYTTGKDIVKLNPKTGEKKTLASFSSEIKNLLFTKYGFIVAFSNKGIVKLSGNKIDTYNVNNSNIISDEIVDIQNSNNGVWLNTHEGLQLVKFGDSASYFYKPEFLQTKDLIFSINNNFCYVLDKNLPNQLLSFSINISPKTSSPLLYINHIKSNFREKNTTFPTLPYLDNYLSLSVGAINYDNLKNKYYYRLTTNNDSGSFRLMEGNILNLRSIESGRYDLRFFCINTNGDTSNTVSYSFIVERPFWELIWFRISVAVVLAGITALFIGGYYRKKNKINKERFETEYKILQLEQQLFRSLMNPHFIFNSLNSIQALINSNKQKQAAHNIGLFSQLVRKNLEDSIEGFCTLNEELTRLKLYVEMENLRFNNCISFSIEKDDNLKEDHLKIPAFILQPLVENSILHGILPNKQGSITVKITKEDNGLMKMCIYDDGIGLNNSLKKTTKIEKRSVALNLISSRLNKLSQIQKKEYKFDINDRMEMEGISGTICTLILPAIHT